MSNAQLQSQLESFSTRFENAMKQLTSTVETSKSELIEKIDGITNRLDSYDVRITNVEKAVTRTDDRVGELGAQLAHGDQMMTQKVDVLTKRVVELEEKLARFEDLSNKVGHLENLPGKGDQLRENIEDRTNRQLRETLVFKNIPEEVQDESYKETKELLATVISNNCPDVSYEQALSQIKRAHRERNQNFDEHHNSG